MTVSTRRLFLSTLAAAAAVPVVSQAAPPNTNPLINPPTFNAADKERIKRATAYLQSLSTGTGRFQQTDYRGRMTLGTWFLQRPGKIRFEYDAPSSLLVVADGKMVNIWDPRLKSFDQYPLSQTPLSLFLSRQIRLDQGVVVTVVRVTSDGFELTARDRRRDVEGQITLRFLETGKGGLRLRDWTVVDAQNRATNLVLVSFSEDARLNPGLFALKNPLKG